MKIDDGVFLAPLPPDDKENGRQRNYGQGEDEVGFKPIVALALVEHNLQSSQAERNKTESDVVDSGFAQLAALEVRRILDETGSQQQRENSHRNINEENPAPGVIVGD